MQMVIGEQGIPLDGLLLKSVGRWKRGLLSVAALLAVTGIGLAQERDPRLKDPAIDFDTVKLATLRPLQFTFVPEWRKLEGVRRFIAAKKLNRFAAPQEVELCESFWADLLNKSDAVKVVEPFIQTNFVSDLEQSPLRRVCPAFDFEYFGWLKSQYNPEAEKASYGIRVYDVSINGKSAYLYQYGFIGVWHKNVPNPITPAELDNLFADENAASPFLRRHGNTIPLSQDKCDNLDISGMQTPFMTADNVGDGGVITDNIVLSYRGDFYVLEYGDGVHKGRFARLKTPNRPDSRMVARVCTSSD